MSELNEKSNLALGLVENSLKIPGVKVNRREFLTKIFDESNILKGISILDVLDKGPIEAGINIKELDKISTSLIQKRTLQSTGASFAAGLPGGFAMAATIPADTLQFFAVTLHLAQELAYVYGYEDLLLDGKEATDKLILFLGVMFGVSGAVSALKIVSEGISKQLLKTLPKKALTKTLYYPIIKKIAAAIGIKVTKSTFAEAVSKTIPVIGGFLSGGITYISMKPMGNRLKKALIESINYTETEFKKDLNDISEIIDVELSSTDNSFDDNKKTEYATMNKNIFSIADELLKFKQLLDLGAVNQEEFDIKKQQLLSM